mmetsp:Transcript_8097/g.24445  ORF Transcript_8097/g.24445 Transcript_8097/m.24445 type:complete len:225 (+) Transcript_8097:60-734(+)
MASNGSSRGRAAGGRAPPIAVRPQPLHIARLGRAVHKARLERVAREDHALVGGEAAIARRIQVVGRNETVVCGLIERSGRRVDPAQREVRRIIRVERHLDARLEQRTHRTRAAEEARLDLHAEVGERADGERRALPGEPRDDGRVLEGANPVVDPLDLQRVQRHRHVRRALLLAGVADQPQPRLFCPAVRGQEARGRARAKRPRPIVLPDAEDLADVARLERLV